MQPVPVIKDLVLLGGGHSHIAVLKSFGMRPIPGVRLTLISRDIETPYSGMLPGLIAGHYTADEAHIDLVPLARFAGARFFHDEVTGVDPKSKTVLLANRPPVSYDLLSVNTGSTPSIDEVSGASGNVVPVKPINRFLGHWVRLRNRVDRHGPGVRIGIVGGGTGGVELCLSVHHALSAAAASPEDPILELFTADKDILQEHTPGVARRFRRILAERGIAVHSSTRVVQVSPQALEDADGRRFHFDEILWVTHAGAPGWLADSGLKVDEQGFVLVNDHLQSLSHANIFGVGDAAVMTNHPRPKAGVFAVRQGPPLVRNLRRHLLNEPLVPFRPQRLFLKLIGTGNRYAVASRGPWSAEGRWVWRWKQWIDRRFMEKYHELPDMEPGPADTRVPAPLMNAAVDELAVEGMRCGGCGAKVGADVLTAALAGIKTVSRDDVVVGLDAPDDAALISVPEGRLSVLSVDAFRPMFQDPHLFGRITANHCLGDVYAMGAEPQAAMALATLPVWPEAKLVDELKQMLLGALSVFNQEGVALIGGHTSEGAEPSLGFTVTGLIEPDSALRKAALREGDVLVLTKAVGTGTLLAADMRAKARGRWIVGAIDSMLLSCRTAGTVLRDHGADACTDVTGFGLAGHLLEMLGDSSLGAAIDLDELPVLAGALQTVEAGMLSTLQPKNQRFAAHVECSDEQRRQPEFALLFDPQTAGGLLAGVPPEHVGACVHELAARGYPAVTVIGEIVDASNWSKRIRLKAG